jgi:uncharacterized membrane protein
MPQRVEGSTEIRRPVAEVYGYWETLENLSIFMRNVEEVRTTGPDTTHWRIKGPFGASLEFDARTTEKKPNDAIGWNTMDGDVGTSGEVRFSELGPDSSRVDVVMNYSDPPGGRLGESVSRIVADPEVMLVQDLKNLKDVMEGEATAEEVQERPAAANLQSGLIAFLTSGAGLALLGGFVVLLILRRLAGVSRGEKAEGSSSSAGGAGSDRAGEISGGSGEKVRFTIEF